MASIWKLYWVESDGYEDCFVVAKNARSAKSIEMAMNDFESYEVRAFCIMDVAEELEQRANRDFLQWSQVHAPKQAEKENLTRWPWYTEDWLLEALGAQFMTVNEMKATYLNNVLYYRTPKGRSAVFFYKCKRNRKEDES